VTAERRTSAAISTLGCSSHHQSTFSGRFSMTIVLGIFSANAVAADFSPANQQANTKETSN
jgi:hypothetical protein